MNDLLLLRLLLVNYVKLLRNLLLLFVWHRWLAFRLHVKVIYLDLHDMKRNPLIKLMRLLI